MSSLEASDKNAKCLLIDRSIDTTLYQRVLRTNLFQVYFLSFIVIKKSRIIFY
jgi:hypothetical protein